MHKFSSIKVIIGATYSLIFPVTILCLNICAEKNQTLNDDVITWESTSRIARSSPLCIKEDLEIAERLCNEGEWGKEPTCALLQKTSPPCPNYLKYLKLKDIEICYTLLSPRSFDRQCPHSNTYPLSKIIDYLHEITTDFVWYSARGNETYGLGEYYYTDPDENYGTMVTHTLEFDKPIANQFCIIVNHEKIYKAVNCDHLHLKLCVYTIFFLNYCIDSYPNQKCTRISFDTDLECICEKKVEIGVRRNEICKDLVEPREPYENEILQRFFETDTCWNGLEKFNGVYIWSGSKSISNYTYWSHRAEFFDNYISSMKDGWLPQVDKSLLCAFCVEYVNFNRPTINLSYNETLGRFFVELNYPNSLITFLPNKIFCFTNSNLSMKTRYTDIFYMVHEEENKTLYEFFPYSQGPAFYWCEAFRYPDVKLVISNAAFFDNKLNLANEYVAKITLNYESENQLLDYNKYKIYEMNIIDNFRTIIRNLYFRRFSILKVDTENLKLQLLAHLTIKHLDNVNVEYMIVLNSLKKVLSDFNHSLDEFSSSDYCYRNVTMINNEYVTWPTTMAGATALSQELCLQKNDEPITRTCKENFTYGAQWMNIRGSFCYKPVKSNITDNLHDLLESNTPTNVILDNLTKITEEHFTDFKQIDIYLIGRLLQKLSTNASTNLENVTKVVSNVMESNSIILVESQASLKATDLVLKNYDLVLLNSNEVTNKFYKLLRTKNLILLIADLKVSNVIGMALFRHNKKMTIEIINSSTNIKEMLKSTNLEVAIFLHNKLVDQIKESSRNIHQRLIITLFMENSLFNEEKHNHRHTTGKAFGVLIPDFHENFSAPVSITYNSNMNKFSPKSCAHWQFLHYSHWKEDSGNFYFNKEYQLVTCEFWHVTHFGLLIISKNLNINFELLDLVAVINSVLSLAGLFAIFLTAILFKTWRTTSNKILLNFVLVITLKVSLLFVSQSLYNFEDTVCIVVGAFLHYSVIAEFCWMFTISLLQYKRLVVVFGSYAKHIVLKTCAIAWSVPLIPVIILLSLDPDNYLKNNFDICYPSGVSFYFSVLLPVCIILIGNTVVFFMIIWDICRTSSSCPFSSGYEFIYRWRTIIFLFFMLGLPWVFAFLAYLDEMEIALHIFNFLIAIQGFIIFLFFVVLNKFTRKLYLNYFKRCCRKHNF